MKLLFLVILIFAVVAVAAFLAATFKKRAAPQSGVYYLRQKLFSAAERSFLGVMEGALPAGFRVFGKVRLEDIFGVKAGLDRPARTAARNRINRKHVDFLIVRSADLRPVAGIELDDSSHEAEDRQERDAFVNEVFASGGIPLLHFPAQKTYAPHELSRQLHQILSGGGAATAQAPRSAPGVQS